MVGITTIMRHEAQLRRVSAQIREASAIITAAQKGCEAAAQELASNWEGAARDAFVAEQIKAKSWLMKMLEVVAEMVTTIDKVNDLYSVADSAIKNVIGGK